MVGHAPWTRWSVGYAGSLEIGGLDLFGDRGAASPPRRGHVQPLGLVRVRAAPCGHWGKSEAQ